MDNQHVFFHQMNLVHRVTNHHGTRTFFDGDRSFRCHNIIVLGTFAFFRSCRVSVRFVLLAYTVCFVPLLRAWGGGG